MGDNIIGNIITWIIIWGIIRTGIAITGVVFIIRAICKYQAKKNAEAFNYDYLAKRIAEETCSLDMEVRKVISR